MNVDMNITASMEELEKLWPGLMWWLSYASPISHTTIQVWGESPEEAGQELRDRQISEEEAGGLLVGVAHYEIGHGMIETYLIVVNDDWEILPGLRG